MTTVKDHPFVTDTKVAVRSGRGDFRQAFVDKVYKTGHFTLHGSPQRYRCYGCDTAVPTSRNPWCSVIVCLWDEKIEQEVAKQRLRYRFETLQRQVEKIKPEQATAEMVAELQLFVDRRRLTP